MKLNLKLIFFFIISAAFFFVLFFIIKTEYDKFNVLKNYETIKNPEHLRIYTNIILSEFLKLHNKFNYVLIINIVLFTVFLTTFYIAGLRFSKINTQLREQNNEIKSQREEIENQKEKIRAKTIELMVLNKELKENAELRQGLTNMIVHDLKNPVSNIISLTDNKKVHFFAAQMLRMIENILDVQKYEGMIMPLNKKNVSLYKITEEAIKEILFLANNKNIKIINSAGRNIKVFADYEILKRIFVNLLTNAVKYTGNNGEIKIDIETNTEYENKIKIKVTDNGIGIAEDKVPLIFNKFNQIIARKTGEARSTGIGLTFCKMAIEAHESDITVESIPGKFTSFSFYLDIAENLTDDETDENISETANNTIKINLNEKDLKYLSEFYPELNKYEVYEIGELRKILNKIDDNFSENVKKWKNEVNSAVYNCNSEIYKKLKEKISS